MGQNLLPHNQKIYSFKKLPILGSFLKESHDVRRFWNDHLSIHQFYKASHRCLYINHRIMSSFKPFTKKMFMKL